MHLYSSDSEPAIDAEAFLVALQASLELLRELDAEVSGGACRWRYTALGIGSGLATVEGAIPEDLDVPEARAAKERALEVRFINGLAALEVSAAAPFGFNPRAMSAALRMASVLSGSILSMETSVSGGRPVVISERTIANLKEVQGHNYTDLGSVEGRLETISLAGRPAFNVRSEVTGNPVRCALDVGRLEEIKQALGRRVSVSGEVTFSRHGEATEVSPVHSLRILSGGDASVDRVAGIARDMTEGMPSGTYVRTRFNG